MQRVLISDPFLFAPSGWSSTWNNNSSGLQHRLQRSNSQDGGEVDQFYSYSQQQFEQAWEDSASEGANSPSYLFDYSEQESEEIPLLSPYLPLTPESMESFSMEINEYPDDFSDYGAEPQMMRLDNSDLVVPSIPSKDSSVSSSLLGEDGIDLLDSAPNDDFRDSTSNFNPGDFLLDDKQLEQYLVTAGLEQQSSTNLLHSLEPVDESLFDMSPSPPSSSGMMNTRNPTLASMIEPPQQLMMLPPPMAATAAPVEVKTRGRKSAHVVKPCSPPSYADSLPGSPMLKQEMAAEVKTLAKRRKTASTSSSASSVPSQESEEYVDSPKPKKRKMHEMPYDPKSKNAVAAKMNREKKKNEEKRLRQENDALRAELASKDTTIQLTSLNNMELQNQVKVQSARIECLQGLARVTKSAGCILQMVTKGIFEGTGDRYTVEFPKWFEEAPCNAEQYETVEQFLQVGKTSSYITLHVSEQEKKVIVDYNPKDPQISHDIPVPQ